jgi:hypothetical protein
VVEPRHRASGDSRAHKPSCADCIAPENFFVQDAPQSRPRPRRRIGGKCDKGNQLFSTPLDSCCGPAEVLAAVFLSHVEIELNCEPSDAFR